MSQENVELVRRLIDMWNRADWDAAEPLMRPDVVMVGPEGWPESETTHGWESSLAQLKRVAEPWENQRLEVDRLEDSGDQVLAEGRWIVQGDDSGIALETETASLHTVSDGKVARIEFFLDLAQARHAAGLPA
jgi:ketosteroid isomerase-like protein